jgi:vitamin B12 transporter
MNKHFLVWALSFLSFGLCGQELLDTITLTEVTTAETLSRLNRQVDVLDSAELQQTPVSTINELLWSASGVDVRTRGFQDVQADIAIRGGTFDQNLVLINGFNMNDPQTGHHQMNLPLVPALLQKVEILQGGEAAQYGPNAFSGAINFIVNQDPEAQAGVRLHGGMHGLWQLGVHSVVRRGANHFLLSWDRSASSGFAHNTDFERQQLFLQWGVVRRKARLLVNAGYLDKAFGAWSFYSFRFPEQYESIKSGFLGVRYTYEGYLNTTLHGTVRRHHDQFELFREGVDFYNYQQGFFVRGTDTAKFVPNNFAPENYYTGHNYHQTNTAEVGVRFEKKWKVLGTTVAGTTFRDESIRSNRLGALTGDQIRAVGSERGFYTRFQQRSNLGSFLSHKFAGKKWVVNATLLANSHSDFGAHLLPSFDAGYALSTRTWLHAGAHRTLRFPTFTDLYYNLGGAIGSADLQPEFANQFEVGTRHFNRNWTISGAIFHRQGYNLIDWVRFPGEEAVRAANITRVPMWGVDGSIQRSFSKNSLVKWGRLQGNYLHSPAESLDFLSLYTLDFLRLKVAISTAIAITPELEASLRVVHRNRAGRFVSPTTQLEVAYEPVTLTDIRLTYHHKKMRFFAEATNLFNVQYADLGALFQPGIWVRVGIELLIMPK